MNGKLEKSIYQLASFIKDDKAREKFWGMADEIRKMNENNALAHIPVGNIETETLDISEMGYTEDYGILTGSRYNEDSIEFTSEKEYNRYLSEEADEKFEKWTIEIDEDVDEYNVYNENGDFLESFDSEEDAEEYVSEQKEEWLESQPNFEDLDYEDDEIYWNKVFRYYGRSIDIEIANEVGLGVLEVSENYPHHGGETFLFLLGCGMDLSPKLMAYQALAFGYIDEDCLRHFEERNLDYTKYVVGEDIFNEVVSKLGVGKFFREQ